MLVRNVYSLGRKLCVQKRDYDYWHRGGSDDIVVASLARLERKRKIIMFNISSWRLAHKSFLFSFFLSFNIISVLYLHRHHQQYWCAVFKYMYTHYLSWLFWVVSCICLFAALPLIGYFQKMFIYSQKPHSCFVCMPCFLCL